MESRQIQMRLADTLRQVAEGMLTPDEAKQRIGMPQGTTADEIIQQAANWSVSPQEAAKRVMALHGLPVESQLDVEPVQTVSECQTQVVNSVDVSETLNSNDSLANASPPVSGNDDPVARAFESKLLMSKEEVLRQVANGTMSPVDAHKWQMRAILSEIASGRMTIEEFGRLPFLPDEILSQVSKGKIAPADAVKLEIVARKQLPLMVEAWAHLRTASVNRGGPRLQETRQASGSHGNELDLVIRLAGRACGILFGIFVWLLVAVGVFGFLRSCFVARDTSPYPYDDVPGQYDGGRRH